MSIQGSQEAAVGQLVGPSAGVDPRVWATIQTMTLKGIRDHKADWATPSLMHYKTISSRMTNITIMTLLIQRQAKTLDRSFMRRASENKRPKRNKWSSFAKKKKNWRWKVWLLSHLFLPESQIIQSVPVLHSLRRLLSGKARLYRKALPSKNFTRTKRVIQTGWCNTGKRSWRKGFT